MAVCQKIARYSDRPYPCTASAYGALAYKLVPKHLTKKFCCLQTVTVSLNSHLCAQGNVTNYGIGITGALPEGRAECHRILDNRIFIEFE
jgi:hypothetical protein